MYVYKNGAYRFIRCDIQKSIKIDIDTLKIIESCKGSNFSEKIRSLAYEYESLISEKK